MLNKAHNHKGCPGWMNPDVFVGLQEYWASPRFKKKSDIGPANRKSDARASLHTGGTRSFEATRDFLEKLLNRKVANHEVFRYNHFRKFVNGRRLPPTELGGWVSEKPKDVYEFYKENEAIWMEEHSSADGSCAQPSTDEEDQLWIRSDGGIKKGKVYGAPTLVVGKSRLREAGTSSFSYVNQQELTEVRSELASTRNMLTRTENALARTDWLPL